MYERPNWAAFPNGPPRNHATSDSTIPYAERYHRPHYLLNRASLSNIAPHSSTRSK
jgi:hypothetical protein